MIDLTMFSPTFLTATVEWAIAVMMVLAFGSGGSTTETRARETP